jgi:hypothetical protein
METISEKELMEDKPDKDLKKEGQKWKKDVEDIDEIIMNKNEIPKERKII